MFGFFFFEEIPDNLTILGLLIVIAAGVFTYYREATSNHTPNNK